MIVLYLSYTRTALFPSFVIFKFPIIRHFSSPKHNLLHVHMHSHTGH